MCDFFYVIVFIELIIWRILIKLCFLTEIKFLFYSILPAYFATDIYRLIFLLPIWIFTFKYLQEIFRFIYIFSRKKKNQNTYWESNYFSVELRFVIWLNDDFHKILYNSNRLKEQCKQHTYVTLLLVGQLHWFPI